MHDIAYCALPMRVAFVIFSYYLFDFSSSSSMPCVGSLRRASRVRRRRHLPYMVKTGAARPVATKQDLFNRYSE